MVTALEIGVGVIGLIIVGTIFVIYNSLVVLRNNISKAWSDIDVLLQQRHDELGKLIDTVSGYMKYEKGVLTSVTQLRSAWISTPQQNVSQKMEMSNKISAALKSIFAVAENYPDLKANASFQQLQDRISGIETQIADRREFYNDSVNQFNIKIQQIPYNTIAGALGYTKQLLFEAPPEAKADVKVKFDQP